ncbi:hypothetical protein RNQ49_23330, partial [Escherichia coli]|nr:hypothetical protein [Escherichia coli]
LAIDQIAQSGLSSLSVIYYSAQLFSKPIITVSSSTSMASVVKKLQLNVYLSLLLPGPASTASWWYSIHTCNNPS